MNTSFSFLILLFLNVNCQVKIISIQIDHFSIQNDYHNLLNRYHELMNEELLEESPSPSLQREEKEGSSIVGDKSTFLSPPSQYVPF